MKYALGGAAAATAAPYLYKAVANKTGLDSLFGRADNQRQKLQNYDFTSI